MHSVTLYFTLLVDLICAPSTLTETATRPEPDPKNMNLIPTLKLDEY